MHMRPWPGKLSHARTKAITVVWNQTPDVFLSLSKPVPGPPCLEPDNNSLMRPIKAKFLLFVFGTGHNFFHPCQSPCLDFHAWNQTIFN